MPEMSLSTPNLFNVYLYPSPYKWFPFQFMLETPVVNEIQTAFLISALTLIPNIYFSTNVARQRKEESNGLDPE